jgi:hypothetical protein
VRGSEGCRRAVEEGIDSLDDHFVDILRDGKPVHHRRTPM